MTFADNSSLATDSSANDFSGAPGCGAAEEHTHEQVLVVIVMLSVIAAAGSIGNVIVLIVFGSKRDQQVSTLFIVVMAVVDLSTCVVVVPYTIAMEAVSFGVTSDVVCKLYQFLITSNVPFSALLMAAIALDRYLCICHPFLGAITYPRAKLITLLLGLTSAGLGLLVALMYGVNARVPCDVSAANTSDIERAVYNLSDRVNTTSSALEWECAEGEWRVARCGVCTMNDILLPTWFQIYYQKFFNTLYFVCLVVVIVLYSLICRFIVARRNRNAKKLSKSIPLVTQNDAAVATAETEVTASTPLSTTRSTHNGADASPMTHRQAAAKREKMKKRANLKTAAILFVVAVVFFVAFTPGVLMALGILPNNVVVFYLYFANNAANPVIYGFMNPIFRRDLTALFTRCSQQ